MKKSSLIVTIAVLIAFQSYSAVLAEESNRWFNHKDEGWFFYKEKPAPQKEEPEQEKQIQPQESTSKPAHQIIKEQGELLLGNAMVNPTEENVKEYMEYQKKMLDGADKFSKVWQRVLAKYPDLYLDKHYSEDVEENKNNKIKELASRAGLFFFFRSDCQHCHDQVQAFLKIKEKYGFDAIAVSVDGGIIPELQGITRIDNGISVNLDIKTVPSLYLGFPDENKFEPISKGGALSFADIERRLYHYAKLDSHEEDNSISMSNIGNLILSR